MPNSALPEHLRGTTANGDGTDWDIWPLKYIPRSWTAYGYRATEKWARWRMFPILLFGVNVTRWMSINNNEVVFNHIHVRIFEKRTYFGPSPLQKSSKWGLMLCWPLYLSCWYQFDKQNAGENSENILFFRIGAYWDSHDEYYCFPSAALGRHWV